MPRTRVGIAESLNQLRSLEEQYHNTPQHAKLRLLRQLKEHPEWSIVHIAEREAINLRKVYRWWRVYRNEGLQALLDAPVQVASDNDTEHDEPDQPPPADHPPVALSSNLAGRLLALMSSLRIGGDELEWMGAFKDGLASLADDIDRVSISINQNCNFHDPKEYSAELDHTHHYRDVRDSDAGPAMSISAVSTPSEKMQDDMRLKGFPVDDYHPPVMLDYFYQGKAYIGTLALWTARAGRPISENTLALMSRLEPYISYIMFSHIIWHQSEHPVDPAFREIFHRLCDTADLSVQQRRVALLLLQGHNQKEIAEVLNVTTATIKKHVAAIYRKTNTKSAAELIARYFTPRR